VAAFSNAIRAWSLAGGQVPPVTDAVSVSVTPPAATSAAVGVYIAFTVAALGANVPAPPLHAPEPPETAPASWT
jgi:hypothetical protein